MTDVILYYAGTMKKSFPVKIGSRRLGKIRPGLSETITVSDVDAAWLEANQPGLWSRTPVNRESAANLTPAPASAPKKDAPTPGASIGKAEAKDRG